ncbi:MAG: glycosyltransferase family 4 protein [Myxococcaceae bacterium]
MRTFATLAVPGTYTSGGGPLVGRTVANAQFLKALVRHSGFEELALITGENGDIEPLDALTKDWGAPEGRLAVYSLWQLPTLLQRGALDVLHHPSHVDRLHDLVALRDRYASRTVPVTGQIHSLSYPRTHQELARMTFIEPSKSDGIFCSSSAGRLTMERGFEQVAPGKPHFELMQVPLGVDVDALQGGDRTGTRHELGLGDDEVLLLCLARFTEYDKADLFPLLRVMERLVRGGTKVKLLLAGARQGTRTPEMLQLWARHLGLDGTVQLELDFAEARKKHLLAAADVFVSPVDNIQETFGQSVVEAMAAGLPVVASDFDGYRDTVSDEVGIRIPARLGPDWSELSELAPLLYERPLHLVLGQSVELDLDALEKALRELAQDRARREALGKAAKQRAQTLYAWPKVIAQYEAHWERLAATGAKPSGKRHPLRLDFEQSFGHFFTGRVDGARALKPNPLAKDWIVYPELKNLFDDEDVRAAMLFAANGCTFDALEAHLAARLKDRSAWVPRLIATWLVKQGLLQ